MSDRTSTVTALCCSSISFHQAHTTHFSPSPLLWDRLVRATIITTYSGRQISPISALLVGKLVLLAIHEAISQADTKSSHRDSLHTL